QQRHGLRSQLSGLGFGTAAPGVWIAPAYLHEATADMLERLGLSGYADLFRADHLAFGDLAAKVAQWWDLARTERLACDFVTAYEPVLRGWAGRRAAAHPREAFADYVRVLTDWRRLPYLDPGLPAELLPPGWARTPPRRVGRVPGGRGSPPPSSPAWPRRPPSTPPAPPWPRATAVACDRDGSFAAEPG